MRRASRKITKQAGLGTAWSPRELRHSFVSIMSDQGVPIETIADLVGHAGTSVTEAVYRHQLRPVDHQRCPDHEHHLRRQPTRVESPSEMAPRLAPIDSQTREKGLRMNSETPCYLQLPGGDEGIRTPEPFDANYAQFLGLCCVHLGQACASGCECVPVCGCVAVFLCCTARRLSGLAVGHPSAGPRLAVDRLA
ncbi:tyrosine-type recombinase/integrase [Nonomuraea sp. 3N208]|uniref:tyrosine-type recombinase/integrase n=1 Tax=Nonomuraea sp. 3N208 TaxID=3457421 RepID=UPI003FD3EEB3